MFRKTKQRSLTRGFLLIGVASILGTGLPIHAQESKNFSVDATQNIYRANDSTAPAFPDFSVKSPPPFNPPVAGYAPTNFGFNAGDWKVITFTNIVGDVVYNENTDANGNLTTRGSARGSAGTQNISAYNNFTGIRDTDSDNGRFYLVGVFTNGNQAPATSAVTNYDFASKNMLSFSPTINQVFYIGEGHSFNSNSQGALQNFYVPDGATRLSLGFAEAPDFNGSSIGDFSDNIGGIGINGTININPVPAPPAFVSLCIGLTVSGGTGWWRRGRKYRKL